jgi:hypothetical protein
MGVGMAADAAGIPPKPADDEGDRSVGPEPLHAARIEPRTATANARDRIIETPPPRTLAGRPETTTKKGRNDA